MLLPAAGLAYTAGELPATRLLYLGTAALSAGGAAVAVGGLVVPGERLLLAGIALVGIGQTIGIADASYRDQNEAGYADAPESDGLNLREYFYQQHDWTHPVIGDALDVIRTVRAAERHLTTAVFGRL
jgi:hypothetical protein